MDYMFRCNWYTLSFKSYDNLGQLIKNSVGGSAAKGVMPLQIVDYTYNVRGWLTDINDVNTTLTDDLFAFRINYNGYDGTSNPQYNGNISETHWKNRVDNEKRHYIYEYDALNRLTNAKYNTRYTSSTPRGGQL